MILVWRVQDLHGLADEFVIFPTFDAFTVSTTSRAYFHGRSTSAVELAYSMLLRGPWQHFYLLLATASPVDARG